MVVRDLVQQNSARLCSRVFLPPFPFHFCLIGSHSDRTPSTTTHPYTPRYPFFSLLGFSRFALRFMKAIRFYRLLLGTRRYSWRSHSLSEVLLSFFLLLHSFFFTSFSFSFYECKSSKISIYSN